MCTLYFPFCGYASKCRLGHASRKLRRCVRWLYSVKILLPSVNAIFTLPLTLLIIAAKILLEDLMVPQSRNFPHFIEPENLLPFAQEPATWPLSWTKCMPSFITKIQLYIIFPSKHGPSKWSLSLRCLYWNLYTFPFSLYRHKSLFIRLDFINLITFGKERKS